MSENVFNVFGRMGREGPCYHCGIEYTPLWRSGPPEKPVLCNACGSRWRTRGTLEDYFPKHTHNCVPNPNLDPPKPSSNAVGHVQPPSSLEEALANVARKPRSTLDHHNLVMWPTEIFLQELCFLDHSQQAPEIADEEAPVEPEDVLIFERINHYIPENEIGLGCVLLKQG